jgi:hypothetical protein
VGYDTVSDIRSVCVADYDADGDDDLITTGRGGNAVGLLTNDGTGSFSSGGSINAGDGETSCAVGDANNDGVLDVFIGNHNSDDIALLLGDGAGTFTLSDLVSIPGVGTKSAWMLAAGDINGDGNVDVASVNANRNTVSIVFGDGAGQMQNPVNYATGQFSLAVDLGDVDGDGDLDMAVSNHTDANWYLFENDGSGVFDPSPRVYDASDRAACAIFHDRDNDGDLDMTGVDEGDDVLILFETKQGGTSVESADVPLYSSVSAPYPNPFVEASLVEVSVSHEQHIRAELFDALGRLARVLYDGRVSPGGSTAFRIDGSKLRGGFYFVRVVGEDFRTTRTLVRSSSQ